MRTSLRLSFCAILPPVALVLPLVSALAQDPKWNAPASEAAKKNPIAPGPNSIAAGEKVYLKRCVECHGASGHGDGPTAADLGIHPAKLSEVVSAESDGALFWKITTGKKPMPRYGGRLSEEERWNAINYIRTLARR